MKIYRVVRGPVSPPATLYGRQDVLEEGGTLRSRENSWIRQCLRDGRLSEVRPDTEAAAVGVAAGVAVADAVADAVAVSDAVAETVTENRRRRRSGGRNA